MFSSNITLETIKYFLTFYSQCNPDFPPEYIMSDCDQAQLSAARMVFRLAHLLLCWWHVLHAWQQHFRGASHPELWELLKNWIRMTERADFDATWAKIKATAPPTFIDYLYVSTTNSSAFSPTDTMPLSSRAKVLMALGRQPRF